MRGPAGKHAVHIRYYKEKGGDYTNPHEARVKEVVALAWLKYK